VTLTAYATPGRAAGGHAAVRDLDGSVSRGECVAAAAEDLRRHGFRPEVIWAHGGYGEPLFLKQVFPEARLLVLCEHYYNTPDGELAFDPEFPASAADHRRAQVKNATNLLTLEQADAAVTPTRWQHSRFPAVWRDKLRVIHDGIDTDAIRPEPDARFALPDGRTLSRRDEVVTFAVSGLEPIRGIHVVLRALPALFARRPDACVVIAGADRARYGPPPPEGGTWVARLRRELGDRVPWARVRFVGPLPHDRLIRLFQVSRAHVYLTYPFVLSWSVLEAMAAGAPVVGSDTAPLREVVRHGREGLLVDFFDTEGLAEAVAALLADPDRAARLGAAGRARVRRHYDLTRVCLPAQLDLIARLRGGGQPWGAEEPFDVIATSAGT